MLLEASEWLRHPESIFFAFEGFGRDLAPSSPPGLGNSFSPFCPPFSLAVDNILIPENRAHLSPEVQLKELLEKLDVVSAMRSSGARTRRMRLLRREINALRQKLAQPPSSQLPSLNKTLSNGELPAEPQEDASVLEQAPQEEPEDDGDRGESQSEAGRVLGQDKGKRVH